MSNNSKSNDKVMQEIIAASARMFIEHGGKDVTMDSIAKSMHISKRTIYEYFEDKKSLLKACVDYYFTVVEQVMANADTHGIDPMFSSIFMLQNLSDFPRMHVRLVNDIDTYYPELKTHCLERYLDKKASVFTRDILDAQARGMVRAELNVEITAFVLSRSAFMLRPDFNYGKVNYADMVEDVLMTYIRGMLTEKGMAMFEQKKDSIKKTLQERRDLCNKLMHPDTNHEEQN